MCCNSLLGQILRRLIAYIYAWATGFSRGAFYPSYITTFKAIVLCRSDAYPLVCTFLGWWGQMWAPSGNEFMCVCAWCRQGYGTVVRNRLGINWSWSLWHGLVRKTRVSHTCENTVLVKSEAVRDDYSCKNVFWCDRSMHVENVGCSWSLI